MGGGEGKLVHGGGQSWKGMSDGEEKDISEW